MGLLIGAILRLGGTVVGNIVGGIIISILLRLDHRSEVTTDPFLCRPSSLRLRTPNRRGREYEQEEEENDIVSHGARFKSITISHDSNQSRFTKYGFRKR